MSRFFLKHWNGSLFIKIILYNWVTKFLAVKNWSWSIFGFCHWFSLYSLRTAAAVDFGYVFVLKLSYPLCVLQTRIHEYRLHLKTSLNNVQLLFGLKYDSLLFGNNDLISLCCRNNGNKWRLSSAINCDGALERSVWHFGDFICRLQIWTLKMKRRQKRKRIVKNTSWCKIG